MVFSHRHQILAVIAKNAEDVGECDMFAQLQMMTNERIIADTGALTPGSPHQSPSFLSIACPLTLSLFVFTSVT